MFENAKWIALHKERLNGSLLFRKEIELKNKIARAVMCVSALGMGEITVNGENVTDDVLTTPLTRFDARILYQTYDVTALLAVGTNTLGAFVGNGWYNDIGKTWDYEKATWRHYPKLIMQLDVEYTDGTTETFVTNSSWKLDHGPVTYNHVREGETYDATLEQPGWNKNGFDDSGWQNAIVCRTPGGILEPVDWTPIRIVRTLPAKHLGNGVYDFGENFSGWVRIKASGKRGTEICITYAEQLKKYGLDIENTNINSFTWEQHHTDYYIMKGEGVEEWQPRFVYHGFQYVRVENAPEDFELTGCVVHTDLQTVGTFECSCDMLNKIHSATRQATLSNFMGIPTDCPAREQNGWTGDAQISAQQALMNFDMTKAYRKWLRDFKDVQRADGTVPCIVPTGGWGFRWGDGPAWDAALILIPWQVYQNTGDSSIIADMWENMKKYMGHMNSMQEDYIVGYGLGDWCPPDDVIKECPNTVTDTAYYAQFARTMAECAKLMGEDPTNYEQLAENIKQAYRSKFLGDTELEKSQTFIACGIYQQMYNPDEIPEMAQKLAKLVEDKDFHIDCGILGTKYIFTALAENGYNDVLYKMVTNPTMPSYAYWINWGMTALCENWEMDNSLNHHMFSEVDYWFYRHIAGICIDENGITIAPKAVSALSWIKATHKEISVEINENKLTVTVPKTARIIFGNTDTVVVKGTYEFTK